MGEWITLWVCARMIESCMQACQTVGVFPPTDRAGCVETLTTAEPRGRPLPDSWSGWSCDPIVDLHQGKPGPDR